MQYRCSYMRFFTSSLAASFASRAAAAPCPIAWFAFCLAPSAFALTLEGVLEAAVSALSQP